MVKLHNWCITAGLALCVAALSGCSGVAKLPDVIENTSLSIEKDGEIVSYIVGVFDKDRYDLEEMRKKGQEEVAAYNTAYQTGESAPLTLEKIEKQPGAGDRVLLSYRYDNFRTYQGFQAYQDYPERTLFYGTVKEAMEEDYDFEEINQVLLDARGKGSIVSAELKDMSQRHVVILKEPIRVYCPYRVAYFSEEAVMMEDGCIDTSGVSPEEYPVVIVMDR